MQVQPRAGNWTYPEVIISTGQLLWIPKNNAFVKEMDILKLDLNFLHFMFASSIPLFKTDLELALYLPALD